MFTGILVYFLVCFALFFYYTNSVKTNEASDTTIRAQWEETKRVITYMTGGADFGEGDAEQNKPQTLGQILVVYLVTVLMMNLLVGVLSEKLSDIMASKTISSYKLLLGLCIENETLSKHFLVRLFTLDYRRFDKFFDGRNAKHSKAHLVYATSKEESEGWEGSVKFTKAVIEKNT